ncbi:MAG: aspartyl-tRNA(Asn)/glutamyl-tRNA(Gln) amidotransferase subunit A [Gammaproteobacteria bacterium]|jgi:aspartyl-tRNA(Asn)/glutamyl-tRNA(Gln) amidotransferase subunit A
MNSRLAFASITELAALLASAEISAVELVNCYADRIDKLDPKVKAYISLDLERARSNAGSTTKFENPLTGIPYACKDLFDVAGIATTGGSRVLENNIAESDAIVISRLNQSGAIYLGKNNLHEFAYGATGENVVYGTPPNPYDSSRLAGGSSSGSAAAVSHGLCTFALGTDTGGSVRAPAALCGLVGFKPTFGRISTEGVLPYSWTLDHVGSLTRSAADAAIVFDALADQSLHCDKSVDGLRIGIPQQFFYEHCDAEIITAMNQLKQLLQDAGAELMPVSMPSMEHTRTVSLTVQMPEALSYHNRYLEEHGELYSQDFRAGLALGQCLLAEQYIRAKRFVESYRREMDRVFDDVDCLLTPATPTIAPKIGSVSVDIDGYLEPAGNAITRYTSFFNMTGHPAITFPCAMHSQGLPMGAQLIGKHYQDEALLALTQQIESLIFESQIGVIPKPDID